VTFRLDLGSLVMRADTQRKPLGFQEVTAPVYRCVSFCVTDLTREEETLAHSLVFKTKGISEQSSSTSLLQSTFWCVCVTLSNACLTNDLYRPFNLFVASWISSYTNRTSNICVFN
jgi:hypothetical protein